MPSPSAIEAAVFRLFLGSQFKDTRPYTSPAVKDKLQSEQIGDCAVPGGRCSFGYEIENHHVFGWRAHIALFPGKEHETGLMARLCHGHHAATERGGSLTDAEVLAHRHYGEKLFTFHREQVVGLSVGLQVFLICLDWLPSADTHARPEGRLRSPSAAYESRKPLRRGSDGEKRVLMKRFSRTLTEGINHTFLNTIKIIRRKRPDLAHEILSDIDLSSRSHDLRIVSALSYEAMYAGMLVSLENEAHNNRRAYHRQVNDLRQQALEWCDKADDPAGRDLAAVSARVVEGWCDYATMKDTFRTVVVAKNELLAGADQFICDKISLYYEARYAIEHGNYRKAVALSWKAMHMVDVAWSPQHREVWTAFGRAVLGVYEEEGTSEFLALSLLSLSYVWFCSFYEARPECAGQAVLWYAEALKRAGRPDWALVVLAEFAVTFERFKFHGNSAFLVEAKRVLPDLEKMHVSKLLWAEAKRGFDRLRMYSDTANLLGL